MTFLTLSHLEKSFGPTRVVKDFNLTVEQGEFISLLGPSGCGKTTVLRMVAGFETPSSGAIAIDGADMVRLRANARNIGMVFQAYALFPNLTVAQNVGFGLKVKGTPAKEIAGRVEEMLDLIGLPDLGGRYPFQLSGGQQQRVALARALITEPRVLLLDEPLSALDPFLRIRMRAELKRLQRELGITFLHVTHGQDEALALADECVVMNRAVIEQAGPPREVWGAPRTEFVARFMGGHNVLDWHGARVAIRSDEVRLVASGGVAATASAVEYQGDRVALTAVLEGGDEITALVPDAAFFAQPINPGEAVRLGWDEGRLHRLEA